MRKKNVFKKHLYESRGTSKSTHTFRHRSPLAFVDCSRISFLRLSPPTSSHSWQRKDCRRVCICKPPPLFFFFLGVHFPFSIHTGGKWLRCFPCLHCHCLIYISLVLLKQQRHFASLRTDLFVAFHAHFLFHNYLKNSKSMYCTKCLCRHVSQLCAIIC